VRYRYGVKPAKVTLAALGFGVAAISGVLLARTNPEASVLLYVLSGLSALFVCAAIAALVFRMVNGPKQLVIANDYFVVPAALLRPERRIPYVDVEMIREGTIVDARTFEVLAFGRWCGISERSFELPKDYESAIDLIKQRIERRVTTNEA
jgi:hypothetical protein